MPAAASGLYEVAPPSRSLGCCRCPTAGMEAVVTRGSTKDRRRRKGSNGHVVAQLLDSPLPTPRRSCCGPAADAPAPRRGSGGADASLPRRHVPFSWESSPGVPKGVGGEELDEVPSPKPPPGRCGAGAGTLSRAYGYHGHTTDASSGGGDDDDDDEGNDTFSDALDRTSSSGLLAALSARLSAIDGAVAGSRRSPSFIMDRFLPAASAIATTSADRRTRRPSARRSKHDGEAAAVARARHAANTPCRALTREQPSHPPPRRSEDDAAARAPPLPPRVCEEPQGDWVSPGACGLMFFFPWSAKPVLLGFPRSPARCRTPAATAPSTPRRSVSLGDVLEKERDGDLSHWYEEKSGSGKEWSSLGWGTALLGTSKRYCADARKALSRLARSATDGGDGRVGGERRSGKPAASALRLTSGKMPPLSPPSESWLSHARGSNAYLQSCRESVAQLSSFTT